MSTFAFFAGDRVQVHPASDAWMQGDRYGTVTSVQRQYVRVQMDQSGRLWRFHPASLTLVGDVWPE